MDEWRTVVVSPHYWLDPDESNTTSTMEQVDVVVELDPEQMLLVCQVLALSPLSRNI